MVKISVIVAVYKAEDYLHRCVDSLLAQTFSDFEVLLIDDGSPDRSGEMCDEYAGQDPRIRVFHKENGGVSSARQCGIDNARGEYTIHADPDDWVEPTMLEELYHKAKEENADIVICDYYVDYAGRQIYQKQQPSGLDHWVVLKELFQQLHGSCWNKLVKRACYNNYQVKFPDELSFCEDLYTNAWLLKNDLHVAYLPEAFYHYEQDVNPDSLVRVYTYNTYKYDIMLRDKFMELMSHTPYSGICDRRMCYSLVRRAFYGNLFSSERFNELFYPYRRQILQYDGGKEKWFIYLSCVGYYHFAYKLYILMKKLYSIKDKLLILFFP